MVLAWYEHSFKAKVMLVTNNQICRQLGNESDGNKFVTNIILV